MDHSIAAEAISRLSTLSRDIHRPIESGIPEHLTAEEKATLKQRITEVWGSVFFDLMEPLIRQYPDLDPDRDRSRASAVTREALPRGASDISRETLGLQLVDAAEAAEKALENLLAYVSAHSEQGEAQEYGSRASGVRNEIQAVRDLGHAWAGQ
jgi:hypothetical protein